MPVNEHLMSSLKAKYGDERGERVYYAMEAEGSGPFAAGNKLHPMHEAFAARHGLKSISRPKAIAAAPSHKRSPGRPKAVPAMHKMRATRAPKR